MKCWRHSATVMEHARRERCARHANMTPEERARYLTLKRGYNRDYYTNETPEQREKRLARARERYRNMTPEQYAEYRAKQREYGREWYANLTPERREKRLARRREQCRNRKRLTTIPEDTE